MTCATCTPDVFDGCIDGTIYGFCSEPSCGGLCEPTGPCKCLCHTVTVQITNEFRGDHPLADPAFSPDPKPEEL